MYLLRNSKNAFSQDIFKRFLYLIDGKEADMSLLIRITTMFFNMLHLPPLEMAVQFSIEAYKNMPELSEEQQTVVSLMLFNYALAKQNIPTVQLNRCDLANYFEARDQCLATDTILPLYNFAEKLLLDTKTQDKSYYRNLQPLALAEIHSRLLSDKSMLWERFKVKHIAIFGSFSKGKQRIDSDIDLLVNFSLDLTNDEKTQNIQKMAEHYFYVFNRFVDINEVGEYLSNELVKETFTHKKVF